MEIKVLIKIYFNKSCLEVAQVFLFSLYKTTENGCAIKSPLFMLLLPKYIKEITNILPSVCPSNIVSYEISSCPQNPENLNFNICKSITLILLFVNLEYC